MGGTRFITGRISTRSGRPKLKCTRAQSLARSRGRKRAIPKPRVRKRPVLSAPGLAEPSAPQKSRADALAESPRVKLDAPAIYGSIALKGGRIDDVSFKAYRETVDPNSPNIVLLSPAGSPLPYYAEAGFIADPGAKSCPASGPIRCGKPIMIR